MNMILYFELSDPQKHPCDPHSGHNPEFKNHWAIPTVNIAVTLSCKCKKATSTKMMTTSTRAE